MLRRTDSFLSLTDYHDDGSFLSLACPPPPSPRLSRPRLHYREPAGTTKLGRARAEFTIGPSSSPSVHKHTPKPHSQPALPHVRTTSPLAPTRRLLPPRAAFPRSKPEPDLYRAALRGRMRSSPEGEQILRMGPRLAIAILSATRELERIVSSHDEDDVTMGDESDAVRPWGLGRDLAVPCGA